MRIPKTSLLIMLLAFIFTSPAIVEANKKPQCDKCMFKKHAMKMYKKYDKHDKKEKNSLKDKFFHKAYFYLKHKEELGFSEEQIKQIKNLKLETKKSIIMKKAEIEVAALEIKSNLYYQDKIDKTRIDTLIDKKYNLKKEKTKTLVHAYITLKSIPTDKQNVKVKELKEKKYHKKM